MGEVHSGRTVSPQLCHLFPPHLLGSPPCHPASNSDPEGPGDKEASTDWSLPIMHFGITPILSKMLITPDEGRGVWSFLWGTQLSSPSGRVSHQDTCSVAGG